ncbi:hypothetical protein [Novosphingobium sp. JCM 18896]|uniref:hypothetical protein n=1 Tax=Novosphingobium sp. JCM 18896 TaxID=2989731 RepID=UPI002222BEAD|nr:hypothetical protein [Novosphingobium sp. JCM 18896]MCW1431359.1 hypothetical protein [Novosphingobium sp. JCM 18896]
MVQEEKSGVEINHAALPERIAGGRRCGVEKSAWLDGWFISWSPRNDNQNAEGPWEDWVSLAKAILAADEAARTPTVSES